MVIIDVFIDTLCLFPLFDDKIFWTAVNPLLANNRDVFKFIKLSEFYNDNIISPIIEIKLKNANELQIVSIMNYR